MYTIPRGEAPKVPISLVENAVHLFFRDARNHDLWYSANAITIELNKEISLLGHNNIVVKNGYLNRTMTKMYSLNPFGQSASTADALGRIMRRQEFSKKSYYYFERKKPCVYLVPSNP